MNKYFFIAMVGTLFVPCAALASSSDYFSVSGTNIKAAVGATVPVSFTLTSKNFDCADMRVKFQAIDDIKTHTAFTGTGSPAVSISEEGAVSWTGKEMHTGDSLKFMATTKITKGTVGQTLEGFQVLIGCGKYYYFVIDDGMPTIEVTKSSTSVSTVAKLSKTSIPSLFKSIYGRLPVVKEQKYWEGRLKDKTTKAAMLSTMQFYKAKNSTGVGTFKK